MWKCQHCNEDVENSFSECWNCGTEKKESHPKEQEPQRQTAATEKEYARLFDRSFRQARQLLRQGASREQIAKNLQENGLGLENVQVIIEDFVTRSEASKKRMINGAWWCLGGSALTAISLLLAVVNNGGMYLITWGAILFGILQFLSGFIQWSRKL